MIVQTNLSDFISIDYSKTWSVMWPMCTSVCLCVCVCVCVWVYIYICIYMCVCVCVYVCIYANVHVVPVLLRWSLSNYWYFFDTDCNLCYYFQDISVKDTTYRQFKTLVELFSTKSVVFMLGEPKYGCKGEVSILPIYK